MCKNNVIDFSLFKQTAYGNNPIVTKLLRDIPRNSNHVVYKKCHTELWNNCIIDTPDIRVWPLYTHAEFDIDITFD